MRVMNYSNIFLKEWGFFSVNGEASDSDKVSSLIVVINSEIYATLKQLMLSNVIKSQQFETVISKLKDYYVFPK
jgi:hypothetical protein